MLQFTVCVCLFFLSFHSGFFLFFFSDPLVEPYSGRTSCGGFRSHQQSKISGQGLGSPCLSTFWSPYFSHLRLLQSVCISSVIFMGLVAMTTVVVESSLFVFQWLTSKSHHLNLMASVTTKLGFGPKCTTQKYEVQKNSL